MTAANAANAATVSFASQFKEYMMKMPDTFDTKKEIEAYIKDGMKNIKVDGSDKPKRGLTAYQQYVKDNSKSVKNENPSYTGKEVFSLIAKMWKESKESQNGDVAKSKNPEEPVDVPEVKDVEEASDVVPEAKPKAKADGKKKK